VRVHRADIQDRDGAPDLLASIRSLYPWLPLRAKDDETSSRRKFTLEGLGERSS